jgi:hypothetical protein
VDEERTTAADVERERRRLERVRRRERAARRRARRARLLPLTAAGIVVLAAAAGIVLVTGATHPRHAAARAVTTRHVTRPRPRAVRPTPSRARPRAATLPARPTVTLIGDSVADEIAYLASARALIARGVRLRLEVAPCRRLAAESCTVAGYRPQTALELVRSRGRALGQVAIVALGYNDYESSFAHDASQVLTALHHAGVSEVLWLTLRANHHLYLTMNDTIRGLAATTPWLTVVDWNRYSRSHPDWFKDDGLHLTHEGATAMARLVHRALAALPRSGGAAS